MAKCLNDSGYESPKKCLAFDEKAKVHFHMKVKLEKHLPPQKVELVENKDATLASAIRKHIPKIKDLLFWAQIRDHDGNKCVNPFKLQCGFIKEHTEILFEKYDKKIYDDCEDNSTQLYHSSGVFFVSNSIEERKSKIGITHVLYEKLRGYDICVTWRDGETYEEALSRDGRFKYVDRFRMKRCIEGGETMIPIYCSPADFGNVPFLRVTVAGTSNTKRNVATVHQSGYPTCSESKSTSDGTTATRQDPAVETAKKNPVKKRDYNQLSKTLLTKRVAYDFPEDVEKLPAEKVAEQMDKCVKALAWQTLFGPSEKAAKTLEKPLAKLGKIEFANHHILARPVSFTKKLCKFYDSIGYIESEGISATGFLVALDIIATNWHVVRDIRDARLSSTPCSHSEVLVRFDYEDRGRKEPKWYSLLSFDHEDNIIAPELDYAFLRLDPTNGLPTGKPLGGYVSRETPQSGNVCIVGHPFGKVKQDELCPILRTYEGRQSSEIEKRLARNERRSQENLSLSTCFLYRSNVQKLYGEKAALAYDVGRMFEGSSGAPVFDMKCKIVALHTQGISLGGNDSVEVGVTFKAIIDHLKKNGHSDFVRKYFSLGTVGNLVRGEFVIKDEDEIGSEDEDEYEIVEESADGVEAMDTA